MDLRGSSPHETLGLVLVRIQGYSARMAPTKTLALTTATFLIGMLSAANAQKTTLKTPFSVKNAAFTCFARSRRTKKCSAIKIPADSPNPSQYTQLERNIIPTAANKIRTPAWAHAAA